MLADLGGLPSHLDQGYVFWNAATREFEVEDTDTLNYFTEAYINASGNIESFLAPKGKIRRIRINPSLTVSPPAGAQFSVWDNLANNYIALGVGVDLEPSLIRHTYDAIFSLNGTAVFLREISEPRALIRLQTNGTSDNTINRNIINTASLGFSGVVFDDGNGYIEVDNTNGIRTLYRGYVNISYVFPMFSTGVRASLKTYIQRDRAGVLTQYCHDYSYMRSAANTNRDTNNGCDLIDCQPDDIFRLIYTRNGTVGTAINITERASLLITKYE